jgi:hypothetical protein
MSSHYITGAGGSSRTRVFAPSKTMAAPSASGAQPACGRRSSALRERARKRSLHSSWQGKAAPAQAAGNQGEEEEACSAGPKQWPRSEGLQCCRLLVMLKVCWAVLLLCPPSCDAFVQPGALPLLFLRGGGRSRADVVQMAFKFRVITISQTKEKWCEDACTEYASRIKKFGTGLEETNLKPAAGPPKQTEEKQKEEEGKSLMTKVDLGKDRLVLLDERGDIITSHDFADYIQRCMDGGDSRSLSVSHSPSSLIHVLSLISTWQFMPCLRVRAREYSVPEMVARSASGAQPSFPQLPLSWAVTNQNIYRVLTNPQTSSDAHSIPRTPLTLTTQPEIAASRLQLVAQAGTRSRFATQPRSTAGCCLWARW